MQPFHVTIATRGKEFAKRSERNERREGKNSLGSYWLSHELANWFCCDSLISAVCNDIPINSKHFPSQSSIIATQFRLYSCVRLIDRWTDWLNGRWCVCVCVSAFWHSPCHLESHLTLLAISRQLNEIFHWTPAQQDLHSSDWRNWKSNVEEWDS